MNTLVALAWVMRFGLGLILALLLLVVGCLVLIFNHLQVNCIRRYKRG